MAPRLAFIKNHPVVNQSVKLHNFALDFGTIEA